MTRLAPFTAALEVCDPALGGHSARVGALAEAVARCLGWEGERLAGVRLGAALHDVGKIAMRADVLAKPGPLDEAERAHVRTHPVEGAWLVAGVRSLRPALPYVLFHHERWDGGGYPTGRAGRSIPVEGRLLALADAFDAMTSPRPYREALPVAAALGEIERCSGTQFDPQLSAAFLDSVEAVELAPELSVAASA